MVGRTHARSGRVIGVAATMLALALGVSAPVASAHDGETHDVPVPANPETTVTGGGGAAVTTPAPGAQPTPPSGTTTPTTSPTPATGGSGTAATTPKPVTTTTPASAPVPVAPSTKPAAGATSKASGSGSGGASTHTGHASATKTVDGGGTSGAMPPATAAGAGAATPDGELPFTGAAETMLAVLLAGMLVPIGVLLYCGARHGDRRLHLAMPRFSWAPASHTPPSPEPTWVFVPVQAQLPPAGQPPFVT